MCNFSQNPWRNIWTHSAGISKDISGDVSDGIVRALSKKETHIGHSKRNHRKFYQRSLEETLVRIFYAISVGFRRISGKVIEKAFEEVLCKNSQKNP